MYVEAHQKMMSVILHSGFIFASTVTQSNLINNKIG